VNTRLNFVFGEDGITHFLCTRYYTKVF
jgi:hypothetical protein